MKTLLISGLFLVSFSLFAHEVADKPQTVITDAAAAKAVGGVIISEDLDLGIAVTRLHSDQLNKLSSLGHLQNKCAGFEVVSEKEAAQPQKILSGLKANHQKMMNMGTRILAPQIIFNQSFKNIIDQASSFELQKTIAWLSSYATRHDQSKTPNKHVDDLVVKLKDWLKNAPWPFTVETITHKNNSQKSIRLKIPGKTRPNETVVLGAHLDSVFWKENSYPFPDEILPNAVAPGADDNASGSSNLIEALKLLTKIQSFDRTIEFYWYAAEERGLLGSSEIAQAAKMNKKTVIGVLQLDMTLFDGSGEQVIGSMTDFTSPWLRSVLIGINDVYIKSRIIEGVCGYGCSDHASWNRQGYHAIMPFESTLSAANQAIHSEKDVINTKSNFNHSNTFTKYATLFAAVLGNSDLKAP